MITGVLTLSNRTTYVQLVIRSRAWRTLPLESLRPAAVLVFFSANDLRQKGEDSWSKIRQAPKVREQRLNVSKSKHLAVPKRCNWYTSLDPHLARNRRWCALP